MNNPEQSNAGLYISFGASSLATMSLMAVGLRPAFHPRVPGVPNPFRDATVLGVPEFWDHAGNLMDGAQTAWMVTGIGLGIEWATGKKLDPRVLAVGSAGLATGVNIAYESGVKMPNGLKKEPGSGFDAPDAVFGSIAGILVAATYLATRRRFGTKRKG